MKKKWVMILAAMTVCGSLAGCGGAKETTADTENRVYAVEAGQPVRRAFKPMWWLPRQMR